MQSLFSLGNRQVASLNADLSKMQADGGVGVQGQITTTLQALSRTIDDISTMAKQEFIDTKKEKALTRLAKFQDDHKELKAQFERQKRANQEQARTELFTNTASSSTLSRPNVRSRGQTSGAGPSSPLHESPFGSNPLYQPNHPTDREHHALREHTFLQESENHIDQYIAQGRAVLENLVEQRGMLKSTKRRLLDAANTLGLSRETIGWVERRSKQDTWIFGAGAVFTLFMFWVIWHYLG